jgi:hypothetical protein
MVLNTNTWDGETLHRGRCSCGTTWTSARLAALATSISDHTARNHSCTAQVIQP